MSLSITNEHFSTFFLCKGNWIPIPHYVLRSKGNKNEDYGYCKVCWTNDFKDNSCSSNPEDIAKHTSYSDSKINPNSGPCGNDTL